MVDDDDKEIEEIQRKIQITGAIDTIGAVMLALGIYAKFGANDKPFHPLLNDECIVVALLGVGAAMTIWGAIRIVVLSIKKNKLARKAKS